MRDEIEAAIFALADLRERINRARGTADLKNLEGVYKKTKAHTKKLFKIQEELTLLQVADSTSIDLHYHSQTADQTSQPPTQDLELLSE